MQKPVLNLLLVDDDEEAHILLKGCVSEIKSTRFQIDWVSSVDQARKAIVEKKYDILLIDYFIGKDEGSTLLREAKEIGITTPVVMLTGMAVPQADRECMELGAAAFLNKDYLFADILERTIRYALQRQRIEDLLSKKAALDARSKLLTEMSEKLEPYLHKVIDLSDRLLKTNLEQDQQKLVEDLATTARSLSETAGQMVTPPTPHAHAA